jgi:hypothetical protein
MRALPTTMTERDHTLQSCPMRIQPRPAEGARLPAAEQSR